MVEREGGEAPQKGARRHSSTLILQVAGTNFSPPFRPHTHASITSFGDWQMVVALRLADATSRRQVLGPEPRTNDAGLTRGRNAGELDMVGGVGAGGAVRKRRKRGGAKVRAGKERGELAWWEGLSAEAKKEFMEREASIEKVLKPSWALDPWPKFLSQADTGLVPFPATSTLIPEHQVLFFTHLLFLTLSAIIQDNTPFKASRPLLSSSRLLLTANRHCWFRSSRLRGRRRMLQSPLSTRMNDRKQYAAS